MPEGPESSIYFNSLVNAPVNSQEPAVIAQQFVSTPISHLPTRFLIEPRNKHRSRSISRRIKQSQSAINAQHASSQNYQLSPPITESQESLEQRILYRRRLLAIFGRMMASFFNRHTRFFSMGRYDCQICQQKIMTWGWSPHQNHPQSPVLVHEECANRSAWEMVISYDYLVQSGYAPDFNAMYQANFSQDE